jgi:hypothetical protein
LASKSNSLADGVDPKVQQKLDDSRNVVALDFSTELGAPDPVASNAFLERDEPDIYQSLFGIVKKLSSQLLVARRMQIYRAGQAELYKLGKQSICWDEGSESWMGVTSTGAFIPADDSRAEDDDWVLNFYKGYCESFETTASENVPPIVFLGEDSTDPDDNEAAKHASGASELIARNNDAPMLMEKYAHHGWTGGVMATYTRSVTDGNRFGWKTDPETKEPILMNGQQVPKSQVVISVFGALDLTLPETADNQTQMDHLGFHLDIPLSRGRATYPWLKEISPGGTITDDDTLSRLFRVSVRANVMPRATSESLDTILTLVRIWLKPSNFFSISDDAKRKAVKDKFPKGVCLHYLGGTFAAAVNENMDDHWSIEFASEGRGTKRPGLGDSFIQVQDQINILSNLYHEYEVRGIPTIYHYDKAINSAAINKMEARPGNHLPVTPPQRDNPNIPNLFWPSPAVEVPASLIQRLNDLSTGPIGQFLTGIFNALSGSGLEGVVQQTATGFQRQIEQSMGRVALYYRRQRSLHQRTMVLAVKEFAASNDEPVSLSAPGKKARKIDPSAIRKGQFHIYAEADEGYPVLFRDKREQLMTMVADPAFAPSNGLMNNLKLVRRIRGFNDYEIAGEAAWDQQTKEIEDLLATAPEQPDPDQVSTMLATGQQPPPPQPSITVGPLDNDQVHFQRCVSWAESEEGLEAKETNPAGYQNVILHALAHKARMPVPLPPGVEPAKVSISVKDIPPKALADELQRRGDPIGPEDIQEQIDVEQAKKVKPPPVAVPIPVPVNGGGGPASVPPEATAP